MPPRPVTPIVRGPLFRIASPPALAHRFAPCFAFAVALVIALAAAPPCPAQVGWPSRDADLDALPGFVAPPAGYGEVAFYWWLGDPLTRERISWQLDRLAESGGVSGLQVNYAHSDRGGRSYGLTYPSDPPLFSEQWWDLFRWFLGEAKARGMAVSLSDYTLGVPGQGWWIDEILRERPDLCGSALEGRVTDVTGGARIFLEVPEVALCVAAVREEADASGATGGRASTPADARPAVDLLPLAAGGRIEWDAPPGRWKVVTVRPRREPLSIDPMHPECGRKIIETFFGRFEARLPGECGSGLDFFFSDELDFGIGGRLWNDRFAEEFRARKGYDLLPELAALFVDAGPRTPKVRIDYHDVLVALSEEGYFRPVFEWHRERGMLYGCDHGGRGRNVVEFGDYFRTQRWMSGPGCDSPQLSADVVKNKVASSIAHLYLRPRTWLEGYHSSGWGTTTAQIADATFRNFVMGHNLLTLHGLYYSTHGGWWEWAPPSNHFRMPYWPHMRELLACTKRLSYLLSQGHHRSDVAILYPVTPVQAGLGGGAAVAAAFSLGERLFADGIDFDYIDDDSVLRAEVAEGRLSVSGESYGVLVLPAMRAVRFETIRKARELFRGGGTVVAVGALPEASDRAGSGDPELDAAVREVFGDAAGTTGTTGTTGATGKTGAPGAAAAAGAREAHAADEVEPRRGAAGGLGIAAAGVGEAARAIRESHAPDFRLLDHGVDPGLDPGADPGAGRASARPMVLHRRIGTRDVYLVVGAPRNAACFFRSTGRVELWDPWTGRTRRIWKASPARGAALPEGTIPPGIVPGGSLPDGSMPDGAIPEGTIVRMPLEASEAQLVVFGPGDPGPMVVSTDLDEVTSVERVDGRLVVRGTSSGPGARTATVLDGDRRVTLRGESAPPPPTVALDGPWEVEVVPTLDNRFGDFHWPPTAGLHDDGLHDDGLHDDGLHDDGLPGDPGKDGTLIGAEVRRFRHAPETSPAVASGVASGVATDVATDVASGTASGIASGIPAGTASDVASAIAPGVAWKDPEFDDSRWPAATYSFGPRLWKLGPVPDPAATDDADHAALEARLAALESVGHLPPGEPPAVALGGRNLRWEPYEYSLRFGVEGDPGHQGYHGLKGFVPDQFIALGRLVHGATSTAREREEGGSRYYLWTSVASERGGEARLLLGGMRPAAVWLNGARLGMARLDRGAASLELRPGSNPLLLRYDAPGRGYVVVSATTGRGGSHPGPEGDAPPHHAEDEEDAPFSPSARWIWGPGEPLAEDRLFRRAFEVEAAPPRARLRIACDNAYAAWLGGEPVGRGASWQTVDEHDVTGRIRPGRNVLAVVATNDGGPAGLIAELILEGPEGEGARTRRIATDASWRSAKDGSSRSAPGHAPSRDGRGGGGETASWRDPGFDDGSWAAAVEISPFEGSLWATHPQGPPRLAPASPADGPLVVSPVAMRWNARRDLLPYDLRPGEERPAGWYRFTSAPGLRALTVVARGELAAWADGKPLRVEPAGVREDGARGFRAFAAEPVPRPVKVALRIECERGSYGGAAIPEPILQECGPGLLEPGDWSRVDGLACYSGGVRYLRTISLSAEQAASRVTLDLGDVVSSAEVRVGGELAGIRVAPPWRFDLSGCVRAGENRIEVLVYNTLANHYLTVPTRYRGSTVSGLLGPVTLRFARTVALW